MGCGKKVYEHFDNYYLIRYRNHVGKPKRGFGQNGFVLGVSGDYKKFLTGYNKIPKSKIKLEVKEGKIEKLSKDFRWEKIGRREFLRLKEKEIGYRLKTYNGKY